LTLIVKKHHRPRWVGLLVIVASLSALTAIGAIVSAHGATTVPSNYFTVVDSGGVNDVNSDQVDLTQMGRDDTDSSKYSLFWSWDSTSSWAGSGQTGDACALFDTGTDGKIDKAVCARVNNPNADTTKVEIVPQDATHPVFLFNCSNAKNDRCAQPSGALPYTVGTQITAGVLPGSSISPNLITETDPFTLGQSSPHDSTIAITVLKSLVGNGNLVNVCSYPSAGNGGNNNPFDCIVNPGSGFLKIVKVAGTTSQVFSFTVAPTPSAGNPVNITGSGNSGNLPLSFTTTGSVTEAPVSGWNLTSAACTKADNTATGSFSTADRAVTGITVQSGLLTTCTFTNARATGTLTVIKVVDNTAGGSAVASDFAYSAGSATALSGVTAAATPGNSHTLAAGTAFTVTEDGLAAGKITKGGVVYSVSYSGTCSGTIASATTATCTITNTADKAQPGIGTTQTWTLNDSMALTSFRAGGTGGTATFTLYKDNGTLTCEAGTQVYTSGLVSVNNTNGTAATTGGYTTSTAGTYRWKVVYSGNDLNAGITSNCVEVTTLAQ
jgi:hypothetical protein